jgi:putative PIN family toxin of toxin-antitoxin system
VRFVFDTGVVVSGLLIPGSIPRRAFEAARRIGRLLVSEATLGELDDVLRRKKLAAYVSNQQRLEFLAAYLHAAEDVIVSTRIRECRDPKDDRFLELAVDGNATHIISGDHDLLAMHPFRDVAILPPAEFLDSVGS